MSEMQFDSRAALGRTLTRGLLDNIGRQIVTGAFDQKVFPTEMELSLHYKVSRSVTREAVKMLTPRAS